MQSDLAAKIAELRQDYIICLSDYHKELMDIWPNLTADNFTLHIQKQLQNIAHKIAGNAEIFDLNLLGNLSKAINEQLDFEIKNWENLVSILSKWRDELENAIKKG